MRAPPCGDILAAVHDRSMVVGAAGAARLAIGAPQPPPPLFAIKAPPPPPAPTSVVSLNSWAASSSAQGISLLSPLQSAGVPMIYQKPNSRPAKPPPALPTAKGSAAMVPNLGDFPKLTPTAPSNPPARAKQVNQSDGIYSPDPYALHVAVKAPPKGFTRSKGSTSWQRTNRLCRQCRHHQSILSWA